MQWAIRGACSRAPVALEWLLTPSTLHALGRTCSPGAVRECQKSASVEDDRSDVAGSETKQSADAPSGPTLPPPPPQWHKRGTWIDPAVIEKRMLDDEEEVVTEKEPETDVGKSISAIIRVTLPMPLHSVHTLCSISNIS